jgi:glutathione S-transferase
MDLYYHPLSSYSWKVLIALYENATPFTPRSLAEPENGAAWMELWPIARFPVLRDGDRTVAEASVIVEYLGQFHPGPFAPIPADPEMAIEARMMDRLFDNYVMNQLQVAVFNKVRPEEANRDPYGEAQARDLLGKAYDLIEARIAGRTWAAGEAFTLADCAALPALFYADYWLPFRDTHPNLDAYIARLEARPSIKRVLEEKQPWFQYFPFAQGKDA